MSTLYPKIIHSVVRTKTLEIHIVQQKHEQSKHPLIEIKMSDYLPFEIKVEILKRLPVKSLIRLRSVSKAWKSLIDSADFIKHYHGKTPHLLARYKDIADSEEKYVLIADDDTFPQQKVYLTIPVVVNMLQNPRIIGSSHGLLCLFDIYQDCSDGPVFGTGRAVIWNPSIRKAVIVDVPNVANRAIYGTVLGFGVCGEANDPKMVKITHINILGHMKSVTCIPWQVEVFTLSTRAWRSPYSSNLPRQSIEFDYSNNVVVDGVLYCLANDMDGGIETCTLIISFNMTSEEFREVNLPDVLAQQSRRNLSIFKLRESLVVVEDGVEDNKLVFHVWMMEDGVPKSFTKLFTVNPPNHASVVFVKGFRKTGEPIIDSAPHYPEWTGSLAVYEPYSKSFSNLGINGSDFSYVGSSYSETLLLL